MVNFQIKQRQRFDSAAYLAQFYPDRSLTNAGKGPYPPPSADSFAKGGVNKPDDNELGLKDTIRANKSEITRILVRFPTQAELGFNPDAPYQNPLGNVTIQGYVWHCHILEHEDNEMMSRYRLL